MIASNDAAALPALRSLSQIGRTGGRNTASRPKLLLVDDEPAVGRMLFHAAEECGYRATMASTAGAFRCQYEAEEPDVILLDLSLPGGDGIELLRFLAERNCRCPILIVSGHDRRVVEAAKRLGTALGLRMGGCLTKPVRVHELAEALGQSQHDQDREEGEGDDRHVCFGS